MNVLLKEYGVTKCSPQGSLPPLGIAVPCLLYLVSRELYLACDGSFRAYYIYIGTVVIVCTLMDTMLQWWRQYPPGYREYIFSNGIQYFIGNSALDRKHFLHGYQFPSDLGQYQ